MFGKLLLNKIKMTKQSKNPWVAAILNFIFYGAGYIYSGRRTNFGVILLISWVLSAISGMGNISLGDLPVGQYIAMILLSIALAYDGYKTTEEVNR